MRSDFKTVESKKFNDKWKIKAKERNENTDVANVKKNLRVETTY